MYGTQDERANLLRRLVGNPPTKALFTTGQTTCNACPSKAVKAAQLQLCTAAFALQA
jgi:hypothetical protein